MKIKIWHPITHRTKWVKRHAGIATCGECGRSWDDTLITSMTPAPGARCPFEGMRKTFTKYRAPCFCIGKGGAECGRDNVATVADFSKVKCPDCLSYGPDGA